MRVRCTASALVIRALPGGVDISQRLRRGETADAVGQSFDSGWLFVHNKTISGWASKQFLEEVTDTQAIQVKWVGAHEKNYRSGRPTTLPLDLIVIHVIEGTLVSADAWFNDPASQVSAHYGIGLNREIHQYVEEKDTAYHAGRVNAPTAELVRQRGTNPNYYSIGIEHEGTTTSEWPETMYEDSARLVADIAKRHGIPLDRTHVVGHHEIFSLKTCPGRGDVDRIVRMARELSL